PRTTHEPKSSWAITPTLWYCIPEFDRFGLLTIVSGIASQPRTESNSSSSIPRGVCEVLLLISSRLLQDSRPLPAQNTNRTGFRFRHSPLKAVAEVLPSASTASGGDAMWKPRDAQSRMLFLHRQTAYFRRIRNALHSFAISISGFGTWLPARIRNLRKTASRISAMQQTTPVGSEAIGLSCCGLPIPRRLPHSNTTAAAFAKCTLCTQRLDTRLLKRVSIPW